MESTPKYWFESLLRVDSTILTVDFHSGTKWPLIWHLKNGFPLLQIWRVRVSFHKVLTLKRCESLYRSVIILVNSLHSYSLRIERINPNAVVKLFLPRWHTKHQVIHICSPFLKKVLTPEAWRWWLALKLQCAGNESLKTLFNIVEARFKSLLNFDVSVVWWCSDEPINNQEYNSFDIFCSHNQDICDWISPLNKP